MERQKRSWLTRRDKVELFEQIRRELEFGVGTIAGVSRKLGVHRRMVREALRSAEPAASKPQRRRLRKLVDASAIIDRILTEDRQAPVKQRHTARRIWHRLCAELPGFTGSERTVRGYVHQRRRLVGAGRTRGVCSAELRLGRGSASGLVRGVRRSRWRAHQAAGVRDAIDGQRRSISPGLHARHAAGIS